MGSLNSSGYLDRVVNTPTILQILFVAMRWTKEAGIDNLWTDYLGFRRFFSSLDFRFFQ